MTAVDTLFIDAAAAPVAAANAPDHSALDSARTRDQWLRANDHPIDEREFIARCEAAVTYAMPALSPDERADLASEVLMNTARRLDTWQPLAWQVPIALLAKRAVTLWRDARARAADTAGDSLDAPATLDADADADGSAAGAFIAAAAGHTVAPADVDWRAVADALQCAPGTAAQDAVLCALSGYGSATDLATLRAITPATARKRLERGRAAIRERYPTPAALCGALLDADAADRPLVADASDAQPRQRTQPMRQPHGSARDVLAYIGQCERVLWQASDAIRTPADERTLVQAVQLGRVRRMLARLSPALPATVPTDGRVRLSADATAARRLLDGMGMTTATLPTPADIDPIRCERRKVRTLERLGQEWRQERERVRTAARSMPGSRPAVLAFITAAERAAARAAAGQRPVRRQGRTAQPLPVQPIVRTLPQRHCPADIARQWVPVVIVAPAQPMPVWRGSARDVLAALARMERLAAAMQTDAPAPAADAGMWRARHRPLPGVPSVRDCGCDGCVARRDAAAPADDIVQRPVRWLPLSPGYRAALTAAHDDRDALPAAALLDALRVRLDSGQHRVSRSG